MSICGCTNIYFQKHLFDPCSESIDFALNADLPGEYMLNLYFLGTEVTIKRVFQVGDSLTFPLKGLNENFEYMAKIYNPQQYEVSKVIGETSYNCFSFQTGFKKSL